jgi:hypothetical protein
MSESKIVEGSGNGPYEGLVDAIANKHTELDINLQGVVVKLPHVGVSLELSGLVTVTVHVRTLTEDEKRASANKNVTMMSKA